MRRSKLLTNGWRGGLKWYVSFYFLRFSLLTLLSSKFLQGQVSGTDFMQTEGLQPHAPISWPTIDFVYATSFSAAIYF